MNEPELAGGETSEGDRGTYFRFPRDVGLLGLHNSVPGRAIILLAVCNLVWWLVAWDTIHYQVDEEGVAFALASAACLGASLLLLGYIYIAGHARPPWWVYLLILISGLIVPFALSPMLARYAEDLVPALLSWPLFALLYGLFLYRRPRRAVAGGNRRPFKKPSAWSYVAAWVLSGILAGILGTIVMGVAFAAAEPPYSSYDKLDYWIAFFAATTAATTIVAIGSLVLVYGLFKSLRPSPVIPWMLTLGLLGVGLNYTQISSVLQANGWGAADADTLASVSSGCVFLGLIAQIVAFWFIFKHREKLHETTDQRAAELRAKYGPPTKGSEPVN